ncbi:MAG: cadherin-like domain-containing protein [Bauldia sp.]|nr:cadherin-like domain-containing protein [Bauldia sp.]
MANYVVTTLVDETFEGGEGTTPDGAGLSLREALGLALANGADTPDTITFDPSLFGGTLTLTNGQLVIDSDVTIDGDTDGDNKADITVDADGASRVFHITSGTSTLDALTITGGNASDGGGVRIDSGATLTIAHTTVADNQSSYGDGGGIKNVGTLTLLDSTVSGNTASSDYGGGISNQGAATLTNVTVFGNASGPTFAGGAFFNDNSGTAILVNVTVTGNTGFYNGGIYNQGAAGAVTLANSIVAGNDGGDISNPITLAGPNIVGDALSLDGTPEPGTIGLADTFASLETNGVGVNTGALADNGGPVETVALNRALTNPALDAGDATFLDETTAGVDLNGDGDTSDIVLTDARGFARAVDFNGVEGSPDLGAFEAQADFGLVVTTLDDTGVNQTVTGDLAAEIADGGGLSLREALILANGADLDTDATNGTRITFGAAITGGDTAGIDDGVITLSGTQLTISSDVVIDGDTDGDGKADITIDADGASRVLNVTAGTSTLDALTITGGTSSSGGGIFIAGAGDLTIVNATISDSAASISGGGISNAGTLTLANSTLSGNTAQQYGGGIINFGAATLVNVTLSGNSATFVDGGAVFNTITGVLSVTNATVSGNAAGQNGGGLGNFGDATVTNSILAGNTAGGSGDNVSTGPGGATVYAGNNLIGGTLTDIFAVVGANPETAVVSGVLADNGGPVETIAIKQGGLAQNTGDDAELPLDPQDLDADSDTGETLPVDARGEARLAVGQSDIGAFEIQTLTVTALDDIGANQTIGADLAADVADGGGLSLREALHWANTLPGADTITFNVGGTVALVGPQLIISSDMTIDGDIDGDEKADITIAANGGTRVFNVTAGTSTLESLIITGGNISAGGGGIRVAVGSGLTVINSTVTGNTVSAVDGGGGIYSRGTLTLLNTTVASNTGGYGAGVFNGVGGVATLVNTTVFGNASYNGAVSNHGTMTLVSATISGNQAGGGGTDGGGLYVASGASTSIANSIIAGNQDAADGQVGGPGSPTLLGSNIIGDALFDGATQSGTVALSDVFASIASVDPGGYGFFDAGALADNGGPVQTIALNRDLANPALDAGDATVLDEATLGVDLNGDGDTDDVITADARGFNRDVDFDGIGGTPDLGAFEAQLDDSFVVTTLDDSGDNLTVTGDLAAEIADGGGLSLREALILANADPTNATTITFHASLADGTLTLMGGELVIASDVTIDGDTDGENEADITIDADGGSRVFHITGGTSTLDALTITGGEAGAGSGGGVRIEGGAALTIANSTVSGNAGYYGGGIGNAGITTLSNTTVSDNTASYGGGVHNFAGGEVTLFNTTLSDNSAVFTGGGLSSFGAATLANVTVSGNSAAVYDGGGVANFGTATLTNVTLSDNSANGSGGGIYNHADLILVNATLAGNAATTGGGVANLGGSATLGIVNSTFTGNTAVTFGGGIYNSGGTATLTNTIVAGNNAGAAGVDVQGAIYTSGVNLFSQVGVGDGGDIIETDVFQIFASVAASGFAHGVLADNGGVVETVALKLNVANPALDASDATFLDETTFGIDLNGDGDTDDVITTDARGFTRSVDFDLDTIAAPDLGAFEVQRASPMVVTTLLDTGDDDSVTGDLEAETADGGGLSLREALILANALPGADTIVFDASLGGGTVTLTNSQLTISSDVTIDGGAAGITIDADGHSRVFNVTGGTSILEALTITGGASDGAGIRIGGAATLTVANSTISGNSGDYGGGIYNIGQVALTNVTLSGNSADVGGGMANFGTATLTNVTVSGNSASLGGGLYNSATVTLTNSIVAGNGAATGNDDILGATVLSGANIVGDTLSVDGAPEPGAVALTDIFASVVSVDPDGPGGIAPFDAGLLADNGGPAETIAIAKGGVAQNAGDDAQLPADTLDLDSDSNVAETLPVDARGFARVASGQSDIGAFEAQPSDTFVVTTLSDADEDGTVTGDLAAEIADGGGLSLREALILANADPTNGASVTFHASLAGGTVTLAGGELVIASDVFVSGDVDGNGTADITINAAGSSRVFHATAGSSTLDALTITGGYAAYGGGIYVDGGTTLAITNALLTGNDAVGGGGMYNFGTLTMANTTLSANTAGYGGGLMNTATATLANVTLADNTALIHGGGILNTANLTLVNATLAGNSATTNGGGINQIGGTATVFNSTLTGNAATDNGGGIYTSGGTLTLTNTIVAGNDAGAAGDDVQGSIATAGFNLFSQVGLGDADDIIETDVSQIFASVTGGPFIHGVLADNGGAVETVLILRGGTAQNAGSNTAVPFDLQDVDNDGDQGEQLPLDARGAARVGKVTVDLGAVEVQNAAPAALTDNFATNEATNVVANVLANNGGGADTDPDTGDTLTITKINGASFVPGATITLASGAKLTMNASGSFTYNPNDAFDHLPLGAKGQDSFTYTISDGDGGTDTATATFAITGLDTNDIVSGTAGADVLSAGVDNDIVNGLGGNDTLKGEDGNDRLDGGDGKDKLDGGKGKDVLVFSTALNKKTNVDKVIHFKANKDKILLDADIFNVSKKLKGSQFEIGKKADTAKVRIIYDQKSGALYSDSDGKGGAKQVKFAVLDKGLKLDHKDFMVADLVI